MNKLYCCATLVFSLTVLAGCSTTSQQTLPQTKGFLSDYSSLQAHDTASGAQAWRWVSPQITTRSYQQLQLEPLVFYPAPTAGDQVSIDALDELRTSLDESLRQSALANKLPLTDQAGPGTLVFRPALTSVEATTKGFSLTELIPIRLVFSAAELAMGKRDKDLSMVVEYEMVDAETGQVVMRGVRRDMGVSLANDKAQMSIENAKPVIEDMLQDLNEEFVILKQKVLKTR